MKTRIFLGPTLPASEARSLLPTADIQPPAALGDVHRAAAEGFTCILIVDGYFQHTPAVWHKEILYALSQGICVAGAASMGALRAAELHPYGMHGIGEVFNRYRHGHLEDDDEVAVAHENAASGYRPTSVPMVNVRWALERAVHGGRLNQRSATRIAAAAKRLFYAERTWRNIMDTCEPWISGTEKLRLKQFLDAQQPNLKRQDCILAITTISRGPLPTHSDPPPFTSTNAWKAFEKSVSQRQTNTKPG